MNHTKPLSSQSRLWLGACLAAASFAAATSGRAAIINPTPADGETVTVNADAPNPTDTAVYTSADGVTINVEAGARWTGGIGPGTRVSYNGTNTITVNVDGYVGDTNFGLVSVGASAGMVVRVGPTGEINGIYAPLAWGTGHNQLILEPGATVTPGSDGVLSYGGANDTLVLGGDSGSDSFDISKAASFSNDYGRFDHFRKEGDSTWTLTGTGNDNWTVAGGTLIVEGSLDGTATITGGVLTGDGSVDRLNAVAGTVRPGDGIGTLTVSDRAVFYSASTAEVEIHGDGTSDLIDAVGTVTFSPGATMKVIVAGGDELIEAGDQWTVIQAGGDVIDYGLQLTTDFVGFAFTGGVVGNTYQIAAGSTEIRPSLHDPTARAVAASLDADRGSASGEFDAFINKVSNQTAAQAESTLRATTPRPVAATYAVQQRASERFNSTLGDYLGGRRMGLPQLVGGAGTSQPGSFQLASAAAASPQLLSAYLAQADRPAEADPLRTDSPIETTLGQGWGGFASFYGIYDDQDATADRAGSSSDTYVGQLGLDRTLNDNWLVGMSISYGRTEIDFNDILAGNVGGNDVDTLRVGPYVGYQHGQWYADASLTYGLHMVDARRIAAGDTYTADYNSHDLTAFIGGGYTFHLDGGWRLSPEASVQYAYTWNESYRESGPGGALDVDDSQMDTLRPTIGVNLSRLFELGGMKLLPHAQVGWAYDFRDDDSLSATFVGGSNPFAVNVGSGSGGSVYYGAGLVALINANTSLDMTYLGQSYANDGQTDAFRLALRVDF